MRWQELHDDPNTEPYVVIHIRKVNEITLRAVERKGGTYDIINVPGGTYDFHVFYRTYKTRSWMPIEARDELEAFMRADKILTRRKAGADRRMAKLNSTS